MIRPITVVCWFLVLGSGLYLYRAKHDVELLDRRIQQIAKDTDTIRAESRRLLDEWIRLSEPEQLRKYTDQYLGLKTVAPTQFVRAVDLGARLPAARALPPERLDPAVHAEDDAMDEADAGDLPTPPIPPPLAPPPLTPPVMNTAAPPREAPPAEVTRILAPRPVSARVAEPRPSESRVAEDARPVRSAPPMRPAEQVRAADETRTAPRRPLPVLPARPPEPARLAEDTRAPAPKSASSRPAEQARGNAGEKYREVKQPASSEQRSTEQRSTEQRSSGQARQAAASASSPESPRPIPSQADTARSGSMLGMARAGAPLPAPVPVNAAWPGR